MSVAVHLGTAGPGVGPGPGRGRTYLDTFLIGLTVGTGVAADLKFGVPVFWYAALAMVGLVVTAIAWVPAMRLPGLLLLGLGVMAAATSYLMGVPML